MLERGKEKEIAEETNSTMDSTEAWLAALKLQIKPIIFGA
jgi:hypothetical protein